WVLLRDVSRTLLKGVCLIRSKGLLCRMPCGPKLLQSQMNKLCMEMSHSRRRVDSRKARKRILREMKKWLATTGAHARRHCDKLKRDWQKTDLSEKQAEQIITRIDKMIELIPKVCEQAHERIIGGRPVSNKDKLLSVYDSDVNVIVRGKAGREVEFGNTLT